MLKPEEIVSCMYNRDEFSRWLGVQVLETSEGFSKISMNVRNEMCNGFGVAHGGITYSLADTALAFASNTLGKHAVSIETSISHLKPVNKGDELVATATLKHSSNKLATFEVIVQNQREDLVALFRGTTFIKNVAWE